MGFLDGLFGGGGGSTPRAPDPVQLDEGAQKMLDSSLERASESPDTFAKRTSGENQARGLLQNDNQFNQQQAQGAENNPFGSAIRQSYQEKADYGMGRIRQLNDLSAKMSKSNELQQYAKAALGQQGAMTQQMQFLTEAYNKQETARAGFINSLFQTANTGMGMMAGNGAFHRAGGGNPSANEYSTSDVINSGRTGGHAPQMPNYNYGGGSGSMEG